MKLLFREFRERAGLSLEAVASQIPMHKGNLSKAERGLIPSDTETFDALAAIYGCHPADLIDGDHNLAPEERTHLKMMRRLSRAQRDAFTAHLATIAGLVNDADASNLPKPDPSAQSGKGRKITHHDDFSGDLTVGRCEFDLALRYMTIDDRLATMNGIPAADHIGRKITDVLPSVGQRVEEQLRYVLENEIEIFGTAFNVETNSHPGQSRNFRHHYQPIIRMGQIIGVACAIEEVKPEPWRRQRNNSQNGLN